MRTRAQTGRDGLVPLADRIRWTSAFRIGFGVAPLALHIAMDPVTSHPWNFLAVPAIGYLVLALVSGWLHHLPRRGARYGLTLGLLVDGAYLAWAFHVVGGLPGPVPYLMVLHVVGVTLLLSFRTGLKNALWLSLLTLCVLQAEAVALFDPLGQPRPFPVGGFTVFLVMVWSAAFTTATFAAVNERELRRRRYDVEVLRRFGLQLETCYEPLEILRLLAELGREELLVSRVAVTLRPDLEGSQRAGTFGPGESVTGSTVVMDARGRSWLHPSTGPMGPESVLRVAARRHELVLVPSLHHARDPWLSEVLPGAQNLAIVPFAVADGLGGAVVLEYGAPPAGLGARRVERRILEVAEQAAAQGALALGRAMLMNRLRSAAETDGLTRIANRRAFDEALAREAARVDRTGDCVAVALIDLDHFKQLNDDHGHLAGDDALREIASLIRLMSRAVDTVARYGGEEFVVLLPSTTGEEALEAAERIRHAIEVAERDLPVTVSIGVAAAAGGPTSTLDLLDAADKALYAAKAAGRNRVQLGELRLATPGVASAS